MSLPIDPDIAAAAEGSRSQILPDALYPTVAETFGYSYGVRTGRILWIAGQVSRDRENNLVGEGDPEAQIAQVFDNFRAVVEAAGGTLDDVVQLTIYITDRAYRPLITEARKHYFRAPDYPTMTLVVAGLAFPEYLVAVDGVAVLGKA